MTHLLVMAGQAVVVRIPSDQAHHWTDRCEPIRFHRGCRRRATSHKDVVTWRYTVGRPAASTISGLEAPRQPVRRKLRISVAGKNSLFYDPRISRPLTFRSRFCRKILRLIREYIRYTVLVQTLNPAQSINQSIDRCVKN